VAAPGHPLDPIFRPRAVAVIGASADPRKRGYQVLGALAESGYRGAVYPVNPRGGEIDGAEVFRSLEELPETPDLALICLPAGAVPDSVAACGARGIRGAVVLAVGFGESGAEGAALADQLLQAARAGGVRVVGPNTSGILNLPFGLNLIGARGVRSGGLSLMVQSGNIALAFMNEVTARSQNGVAICVGVGNELDVGFHEYLDFLGQDESTQAVVAYVEGFKDARSFLSAAARVARLKPVLLLKGARSESGQEAARSHTGAVAGDHDRLRAGLRQAGVVEIARSDELFHVAETLATQPAVRGGAGVAILSDGGGQGTLASDSFSDMKVPLATMGNETRAGLRALLGRAAAVANPVDLAGAADADPEKFGQALAVLAADPAVGAVLVVGLFGGYGIRFASALTEGEAAAAAAMVECMRKLGKPLVVHSMYATHRSEPLIILGDGGVPVVESLDIAVRCVGELWRRGALLARQPWGPDTAVAARESVQGDHAHASVRAARADRRETLTEPEAAALLGDCGMTYPPAMVCITAEEAGAACSEMGAPVALKVVSSKIPHKTDAGGIELNVTSPDDAARGFEYIVERCGRYLAAQGLEAGVEGVLVSPMLGPPLVELLVGARRDPEVGPVLTVGAGGVWVEVLKDVAHRVLPITDGDMLEMLSELQMYGLLTGARGRERAHLDSIVVAIRAVADCLLANGDVAEVEVNPLFVYSDRAVAVDARVFLTSTAGLVS